MKRKSVLFLLLLSLGTGVLAWSAYRSPTYAIYELNESLEQKDLALFYRRVDLDGLYGSALDALATKRLAEGEKAPDLLDKLSSQVTTGIDKATRGQSLDLVKHELELEFQRDRTKPGTLDPQMEAHPFRLFLHDIKSVYFDDWFHGEEGVLVNARIDLLTMDKAYKLTFRMKEAESGYWRISGFEGLSSLLSLYEADRQRAVDEHNKEFQRMARERLPFFGEARVESELGGLKERIHFEFLFQNKFETAVNGVEGSLLYPSGKIRLDADFDKEAGIITPGSKKVFFIKKDKLLGLTQNEGDSPALDFEYSLIRFVDGRSLGTVKKFEEIRELAAGQTQE